MRLLIDNLDGKGVRDYSQAMSAEEPATIKRQLNASSQFKAVLLLAGTALPVPARRARAVVSAEDGTVLFTGYVPNEPERLIVGAGMFGTDAQYVLAAVSDEWLLDQQGVDGAGPGFGAGGAALLTTLTQRTDPERFAVSAGSSLQPLGFFAAKQNAVWSESAAAIAQASFASYRVLGGEISMTPVGAVRHALDGTHGYAPGTLRLRHGKALVNDVTLSGGREPGAYVSEIFHGDGSTAEFLLSATPFHPTANEMRTDLFDNFSGSDGINTSVWAIADSGSHLEPGVAGLVLNGGNGLDGQTMLELRDAIELGGNLVLQTAGVSLSPGSDGVLCGIYSGVVNRSNCIAGFDVHQSGGSTTLRPLINGASAGTTTTLLSGHTYTLRMRLHCEEMFRVQQTFTTMVDGATRSFGGGAVAADLRAVLELVDLSASSNTPAAVLYDDVISGAAAIATFVPVNSVQLFGSVNSFQVTHRGPLLVQSTSSGGVRTTRTLGAAGEGVDAEARGDRLTFFSGRVPAAGETLTVRYRTGQRAVARAQDTSSVTTEASSGLPGAVQWVGRVEEPKARSSVDCAAAADALLSVATSRPAAMEGEYTAQNPGDLWPGDLLQVEDAGQTALLTIRSVEIQNEGALPEVLTYKASLANDWVQPLALRVTVGAPSDLVLPVPVSGGPDTVPASLGGLTVVAVSGSAIQLDMGAAPPAGGGFEVRRRDGGFGPGSDPDLVVRSPVRGFSLPRTAAEERLYVRAYTGSAVPVYSAVSAAILIHVPVG